MKKVLSVILALMMSASTLTAVYAAEGDGKKDVGPHEHQLMDMANMSCHYSECTICGELFGVGDHTFKDGKCTVCGHPEMINPFEDVKKDERINPFVDVKKDAWYHDEIVEAVYTGIINGKSATIFAPDDLLTYAEAVKIAACMSQVYLNGKVTLTAGSPWYQPYADYCRINNITTKDYDYNANATRAGYIEIFANALPDSAFEDINNIPDGSILDVKDNAPYTIYVYKMYRAGILTGVDALHSCKPEDNIKRSEVAAIISRMMNDDKRIEFDMPGTSGKEEPKEEPKTEEPGTDNQKVEIWDDPTNIPPENPEATNNDPAQTVTPDVTETPTKPVDGGQQLSPDTELTIHKQPESFEADEYGIKYEAEVQVYGGKPPYSYQWFYYTGHRNNTDKIANGDYVKDVTSDALVLSVEKENTLLGRKIYCEITDSAGTTVTTDTIKVYGPFSMSVDESLNDDSGKNVLTGRVADGILKKGEKVSVIRDGKVIAIGVAEDLQMFSKSLDEIVKGDNVEIVFDRENGVRPTGGDIVVKYQPSHKIDTSDIVN